MIEINDTEFSLLKEYVSQVCGIDIPPEKKYLFRTRLSAFLSQENCRSFSEFYNRLTTSNDKILERQLVQAMTTHETSFFRDSHPFDALTHRILPDAAARRLTGPGKRQKRLRILSCGCSSGQEPYSIAICVSEWLATQKNFQAKDITILGVDISKRVLVQAARGMYAETELGKALPSRLKSRYFSQEGSQWMLDPEVRNMVNFAELNLVDNFAFIGRFDIIFCRNVIIYFSLKLKRHIVLQFHQMLNPGAVLMLGASESLYMLSDDFSAVHCGPTTYYTPKQEVESWGGRPTAAKSVTA